TPIAKSSTRKSRRFSRSQKLENRLRKWLFSRTILRAAARQCPRNAKIPAQRPGFFALCGANSGSHLVMQFNGFSEPGELLGELARRREQSSEPHEGTHDWRWRCRVGPNSSVRRKAAFEQQVLAQHHSRWLIDVQHLNGHSSCHRLANQS